MLISSLANPKVKAAVRLRDRKGRDQQGRIVIDGTVEIARALEGGVKLLELFVCQELIGDDERELSERAAAAGAQQLSVTRQIMEKLAFGRRVLGLLAVGEMPRRTLADVDEALARSKEAAGQGPVSSHGPLLAVLEGIEKPGNLGAVLRSADAAAISALVVADGGTDLYNPNAIRASLGAIFTVPVCAAASGQTLAWLRQRGCQIVAARVDGVRPYTDIDFRRPTAIVLGSEDQGLSKVWRGDDVASVHLPMFGKVDSLNVSATAAILFYEALRQRLS
jgi:TrmH family RNA methyltransferase